MAGMGPPRDLDKTAKQAWRDLVKLHGHLTPQDAPLLRVYAMAVSTFRRAEEQLAKEGLTVQTQRGFGKHPCATISHEARQTIIRSLRELKCAASTRKAASKSEKTETPFIKKFEVV